MFWGGISFDVSAELFTIQCFIRSGKKCSRPLHTFCAVYRKSYNFLARYYSTAYWKTGFESLLWKITKVSFHCTKKSSGTRTCRSCTVGKYSSRKHPKLELEAVSHVIRCLNLWLFCCLRYWLNYCFVLHFCILKLNVLFFSLKFTIKSNVRWCIIFSFYISINKYWIIIYYGN